MREESRTDTLARLVAHARVEVLPIPSVEDRVLAHLPRSRTVTVTASPSKGLGVTLDLTERLAVHGYQVVPHLAARMISGRSELREIVERLAALGITGIFVPAGDADPVGAYHDGLALLQDLAVIGNPFQHVGITGYPESHPTIHDDVAVQSMWDKRHYATHVVSNLTFSAAVIDTWIRRLRARGVVMPVLLGVPGPVHRAKLLAMATKIGVGDSTRFLVKNKGPISRLAAPGGFTAERFLFDCAPSLGGSEARVDGLHVFSFNQIAETEAWLSDLRRRLAGGARSSAHQRWWRDDAEGRQRPGLRAWLDRCGCSE
jgi:methylenetetrahydrofolate reductase (NADPH)